MSKYGLKVFNGKNAEYLSTLESFVFFKRINNIKKGNYNTGIKETDDPPMIFSRCSAIQSVIPASISVIKKDGYWNITCQQNGDVLFECYLFVRASYYNKVKSQKWGIQIFNNDKLLQVSGARPLRIQSITGFSNGRPIGNELSVGIQCASLCRVVGYYSTPTSPYQHAVIEVGSCGSGTKIVPMRWQLTVLPGASANSSTDDVVQYINIKHYQ